MRFHVATIPVIGGAEAERELNAFLASHRVVAVERHLVTDGPASLWTFCVTYTTDGHAGSARPEQGRKGRVDYKDVLTPEQFAIFARLREARKVMADQEGIPPYAVFTNEQLAEIVQRHVTTLADLAGIDGVGPARVERYGRQVVDVVSASVVPRPAASAREA